MTAIPKPARRSAKPRKRPRKQRKSTPAQLAREADKLWSTLVRSKGSCEAWAYQPPKCSGALQAAHGFSRRYRHTRWLPINGFALCQAHHMYWTHNPLAWEVYLRKMWGPDVYDDLRHTALLEFKPDVGAALEALKDEAKARGIQE